METILLTTVVIALLGLAASTAVVGRIVLSHKNEQPIPAAEPESPKHFAEDIGDLNARMDRLTNAVADGIERVSRSENRIQKTVTSARRLVREAGLEHAGVEAEFEELQPPDAEGIQPLPPMPPEVEETRVVRFPGGELEIGAA